MILVSRAPKGGGKVRKTHVTGVELSRGPASMPIITSICIRKMF